MDYDKKEDSFFKYVAINMGQELLKIIGVDGKIKEVGFTEDIKIKVDRSSMDFLYLLDNDTYIHLEFQSTVKKNDLIRFAEYDLGVIKRSKRSVNTYVLYTCDDSKVESTLKRGSISYTIFPITLKNIDWEKTSSKLKNKIKDNKIITKEDMLTLLLGIFSTPNLEKMSMINESLTILNDCTYLEEDGMKLLYLLSSKFLDNNDLIKVKEVIAMTKLGQMLFEDGKKAQAQIIAERLILEGMSIQKVSNLSGLTENEINSIKEKIDKKN